MANAEVDGPNGGVERKRSFSAGSAWGANGAGSHGFAGKLDRDTAGTLSHETYGYKP